MSGGQNAQAGRPVTYDVFVGNLSDTVTEAQLRELFGEYGEINSVYVKEGNKGGLSFGFVRFGKEEEAEKAAQEGNAKMLNGQVLNVRRSERKKPAGGAGIGGPKFGGNMSNKPDLVANHQSKPFGNKKFYGQNRSGPGGEPAASVKVLVSHVESPLKFWVQMVDQASMNEMSEITEKLSLVCPSAQAVSGKPQQNKVYATRFSLDGMWYRCKIVKEVNETESQVFYIDYGNGEVKPNSDIVELLPNLQTMKAQATQCVLFGLKPTSNCNMETGTAKLRDMVGHGELTLSAQFITGSAKLSGNFLPTILFDDVNNIDINQEMLNGGYGERRFTAPPKVSRQPQSTGASQQNAASSMASPPRVLLPTPQKPKSEFGGTWDDKTPAAATDNGSFSATLKSLEQTAFSWVGSNPTPHTDVSMPPPTVTQAEPRDTSNWADVSAVRAEANQMRLELQRQNERLQQELSLKNEELRKSQADLVSMTGKFKTLQMDFNKVQGELQEANLTHKMKNLIGSVQTVKMLRRQFPAGEQNSDIIDQCLEMFADSTQRISVANMEIIAKVKAAMDSYLFIQNKVKEAGDLTLISDLLPARDEARKQLHQRLGDFQDAMTQLPFEDRGKQLQASLDLLQSTYSSYLDTQVHSACSVEDITNLYKDWKAAKVSEFEDARTCTNTEHNALNSALRLVQQQLCLSEMGNSDSLSPPTNIDSLLASFQKALSNEVVKTNMLESTADAPKICLMVHSLKAILHSELEEIQSLRDQHVQYSKLQADLEPWLSDKPNVDDIMATRKLIKSLKSKLRHKLADKVDLEEEDPSGDELQELCEEISKIRLELQTAFRKEDDTLAELSLTNDMHFPELSLQHPEVGINKDEIYGGLVKQGWTLEHFDLQPLENVNKSSILRSSYCSQPIVIKEYIIDESLGVKKNEVLRRALTYSEITNPHVLPIQAVFFAKSERQVYLQLPYYEHSLASRMAGDPLSPEEQFHVLRDLLEAINTLHEARLIHGVIHPNNVFLDSEGHAILADYDVTKSLEQRAEKTFTSPHGLNFAAPEVLGKSTISRATDMYSLGVIAYWLHCPEASTLSEFHKSPENDPLEQLLHYLLNPDPQRRCSAFEAAAFPFFSASRFSQQPSQSLPLTVTTEALEQRPRQPSPKPNSPSVGILKNGASPRNSISGPSARVSYGDTTVFKMEQHSSEDEAGPKVESGSQAPPDLLQDGCHSTGAPAEEEDGPTTPLPCSTMGTPVNTPIEGELENPQQDQEIGNSVRDLVASAAEQAALLAGQGESTESTEDGSASQPPILSNDDVVAIAEGILDNVVQEDNVVQKNGDATVDSEMSTEGKASCDNQPEDPAEDAQAEPVLENGE